ncbi:hypothetical protein ACFYUD_04190 [Nocardia tengchongensis]|uniref:hypothetical protein n=1 Tax=Nocardia tengchongensis TaxID=2055889 RepID=UPI0036A904FE
MAAIALSGCSNSATHQADTPACTSTFDFGKKTETLGSSEQLNTELRNAVQRGDSFQLADVTRAAGWSDNWDRMVKVQVNIKAQQLNQNAGTTNCWANLPESDGEGYRPPQFYLFVKDGQPVQKVQWPDPWALIDFGAHTALTKDSTLGIAKGKIVAQP